MGRSWDIRALIIGSDRIASYKIGIEQPFRYLQKHGICRYDVTSDENIQVSAMAAADIIIFFRTVKNEAYKSLEIAREMGKKTVYVIDDHFLAMSPTTDIGGYYHEESKRSTYIRFLRKADIVKVASPFFAKHLETHFQPQHIVCFPGSVDFSTFDGLKKDRKHDDTVVIGYEGGKKSIAFEPVIKALRGIIRTYGHKVKVEFFGYVPEEIKGKPQVAFRQHNADYKGFLKSLYRSNWDIGLAPLELTLLHDCKTNNKFREYGACGIPGIYTSSPAYRDWVVNRENGMLVSQTRDGWYDALVELIDRPELREKIKENAEIKARESFSVEVCADQWHKQILLN
ncbi:MAG: glycosyltransferase [Paenibacillaceae bacterium]